MTRIEKIKAATQKVKQGRVKVYSKEEKKLFDSLKQVCADVVIAKANNVRDKANSFDEKLYVAEMTGNRILGKNKQMSEVV